ncbi:MAG: glycosyltransferase family 2 protein [Alphaproteobacteria bacterium]
MAGVPARPHLFRLSVVVPCFNEEAVIEETNRRLLAVLGAQEDFELELVYVDDGSSDATETLLADLAEQDARINVVSLARNFGHQPAITAGIDHVSGDVVAVIDGDLQDPPEIILQMLGLWRQGYDVVYGVRRDRKEGLVRRAAYALFYRLHRWLADIDVPLDSGDFSLMDRRVIKVLRTLPEHNRFVRGLRAWSGFRQVGLPYERQARAAGITKYGWPKLLRLALDGIINFSAAPLTGIFILGVCASGLAALAASAYLVAYLASVPIFGRAPEEAAGFMTLILVLLFFSGLQLICIGILGEYLGRVYQEAKRRPVYVVKDLWGVRFKEER